MWLWRKADRKNQSHSELAVRLQPLEGIKWAGRIDLRIQKMAVLSRSCGEGAPCGEEVGQNLLRKRLFPTRAAKKCIYMAGTPVADGLRRRIGMKYFGIPQGGAAAMIL